MGDVGAGFLHTMQMGDWHQECFLKYGLSVPPVSVGDCTGHSRLQRGRPGEPHQHCSLEVCSRRPHCGMPTDALSTSSCMLYRSGSAEACSCRGNAISLFWHDLCSRVRMRENCGMRHTVE